MIGNRGIEINFTGFLYNWNTSNIFIVNEFGNKLNHEIEDRGLNGKYLKFDAFLENKINIFFIYGSTDLNLANSAPISSTFLTSPNDFTYIFGVAENLEGINKIKFNNLETYNTLKNKWGYPINRDFIIKIYNGEILSYEKSSPSKDKDVNIIRTNEFILFDNGTKENVILEIRVW